MMLLEIMDSLSVLLMVINSLRYQNSLWVWIAMINASSSR